jgi:hypothetical protein
MLAVIEIEAFPSSVNYHCDWELNFGFLAFTSKQSSCREKSIVLFESVKTLRVVGSQYEQVCVRSAQPYWFGQLHDHLGLGTSMKDGAKEILATPTRILHYNTNS